MYAPIFECERDLFFRLDAIYRKIPWISNWLYLEYHLTPQAFYFKQPIEILQLKVVESLFSILQQIL